MTSFQSAVYELAIRLSPPMDPFIEMVEAAKEAMARAEKAEGRSLDLEREIARLKSALHDADTIPYSEWAPMLAIARENVEASAKLAIELQIDNARLRVLIKQAEWCGKTDLNCPWCGTYQGQPHHTVADCNCPAFTADGEVK